MSNGTSRYERWFGDPTPPTSIHELVAAYTAQGYNVCPDKDGGIVAVTYSRDPNQPTAFTHDADGRLVREGFRNGCSTVYGYNDDGGLGSINYINENGETVPLTAKFWEAVTADASEHYSDPQDAA